MAQKTYVFAYGSLMSERGLHATLPGKTFAGVATLKGYRRSTSKISRGLAFMNLEKDSHSSVEGKVIEVNPEEFEAIRYREQGLTWMVWLFKLLRIYNGYYVVDLKQPGFAGLLIAFIAPPYPRYRDYRVLRSYLEVCLEGVEERKQRRWMAETKLGYEIIEDLDDPQYGAIDETVTKTPIWNG